jgi:hypothetical protein
MQRKCIDLEKEIRGLLKVFRVKLPLRLSRGAFDVAVRDTIESDPALSHALRVLDCRGRSPSQAPKSRPRSKASPSPMAAMAVEMIDPTPGTVMSSRQLRSSCATLSISPVRVSIRSSSQSQSS